MQEPDLGGIEGDPCKEHLDDQEQEEEAVATEPPLPDATRDSDEKKDQAGKDDDVAEACVKPEAVLERVLVDDTAVVRLVGDEERSVASETNLEDDHQEEERRPSTIKSVQHVTSR